jgi:hypothetical protein
LAKGIEEAGLKEEDGLAVKAVQDRFVIAQIVGIMRIMGDYGFCIYCFFYFDESEMFFIYIF